MISDSTRIWKIIQRSLHSQLAFMAAAKSRVNQSSFAPKSVLESNKDEWIFNQPSQLMDSFAHLTILLVGSLIPIDHPLLGVASLPHPSRNGGWLVGWLVGCTIALDIAPNPVLYSIIFHQQKSDGRTASWSFWCERSVHSSFVWIPNLDSFEHCITQCPYYIQDSG